MAKNFQKILFEELQAFFEPLARKAQDPTQLLAYIRSLGYDVNGILVSPTNSQQFATTLGDIAVLIQDIQAIIDNPPQSIEDLFSCIEPIKHLAETIKNLSQLSFNNQLPALNLQVLAELPAHLLGQLLAQYLFDRYEWVYRILELLTIIRKIDAPVVVDANNKVLKNVSNVYQFDFVRLIDVISDPSLIAKEYWLDANGQTRLTDQASTNEVAIKLFTRIAHVLKCFGIETVVGKAAASEGNTYPTSIDSVLEGLLIIKRNFWMGTAFSEFGVGAGLLPQTKGGPGVFFAPFGELVITQAFGKWALTVDVEAQTTGIQITANGITFYDGLNSFKIGLLLETKTGSDKAYVFGSLTGTRLEVGKISVGTNFTVGGGESLYGFSVKLEKMLLVIQGGDGDGFIAKILKDGIKVNFDLGVAWDNKNGVHFSGGGSLDIRIPAHIKLGPIEFLAVRLGLGYHDGKIPLTIGGDLKVSFGSTVVATVENMGLKVALDFPGDKKGNMGPVNIGFGFKLPSGIGLSIDASAVKGAGYLYIDSDKGRYVGAVEIDILEKIHVVAIGIITTKMPDGTKGFTMLVLIAVEFSPGIQVGMGFAIGGLGLLVGIQRSMNLDFLRTGIKTGAVDSILFPRDVIARIDKVISDLEGAFPIERKKYSFGVMALITWGAPALVTIKFGLFLEVPDPVRLAIMGKVSLILPDEKSPIIKLNVAFLGTIDFGEGLLTFDASIYDSTILVFSLFGDMAVRVSWGKQKEFLLSVGGFHPIYKPASFLKLGPMDRITISLLKTKNPTISIESYFAITSNTVQFGAKAMLLLKISKFRVFGYMAFDVLFQFKPFFFIASIEAGIGLYWDETPLLAIILGLSLSGPTPWRATGKATFKIFGIGFSANFDKTWGDHSEDALPDVSIIPLVKEAFENAGNWHTIPLGDRITDVSIRKLAEGNQQPCVLQPSGVFTVTQKIAPLGVKLEKFGNMNPADCKQIDVGALTFIGSGQQNIERAEESFAPAQFFKFADDDKLAKPSYEKLKGGVKIVTDNAIEGGAYISRLVQYDRVIMDNENRSEGKENPLSFVFYPFMKGGAIGKSQGAQKTKKAADNASRVTITRDKYHVVRSSDLKPPVNGYAGSQSEAIDAWKKLIAANPDNAENLIVVHESELVS